MILNVIAMHILLHGYCYLSKLPGFCTATLLAPSFHSAVVVKTVAIPTPPSTPRPTSLALDVPCVESLRL